MCKEGPTRKKRAAPLPPLTSMNPPCGCCGGSAERESTRRCVCCACNQQVHHTSARRRGSPTEIVRGPCCCHRTSLIALQALPMWHRVCGPTFHEGQSGVGLEVRARRRMLACDRARSFVMGSALCAPPNCSIRHWRGELPSSGAWHTAPAACAGSPAWLRCFLCCICCWS
jgi:hypothetical protein